MRLFSEKVNPTFNSSGYNILTVKDYTEVFFDVYEFEINGSRFVAEKTGVFEDSPIVSIPVDHNNIVEQYDFVLHKGSQSIHFDPSTTSTPSHLKSTSDVEPLLVESVEEETDEVFLEDKKVAILEEIEKAKVAAAKYISQIEKQNKRELVNYQTEREVALKEDIDEQKKILLDEFYTLVEGLRVKIAEESNDATLELKDLISDQLKKVSSNVDAQIASAERAIDTKIEERANELLNNVLLSEVKRSSKDIADNLNSQVKTIAENISKSLTSTKKQIEVDITEKLQEISTELNAKDKAIVELNDNVNKQSNRALSRIGTVKTQLEGTVKDVVDSLEARIDSASDKLTNYYNEKLQLVEASLSDASEHTKNHILGLIKESHQSLQNDIANIKVTVPNIVIEKSNGKQEIDVTALRTELEKSVSGRFVNEISSLKRLIELSSGGGSVAMQFAAGGTMNGNLTVVGAISASQYLGLSYLLNDYLPLSGGTVTGDVSVTGLLSAGRIYTTQLDALSANITVIDIKQYELSGFNVTGDVTINGSVSSQNISAANLYSNGVQVATVVDPVRTTLTGNGVLSTFAISGAGGLVNPSALIVAIDGALQEPSVDYTVNGGSITFTSPLANGSKAVVISPVNTVQVGQVTPSDGSVTSAKLDNALTIQNLTSPLASIDSLIINDQATAENQTYSSFDSILTPRVNAGLRGYILNRKCNVGGTWATSHTSGGGSTSRPSHVEMFTNTTLGSKSYIYEPQLNLCELGAATRNGYSTIKWNMSEMWFDWVFNMTYAIFSSNIRTNQMVKFFVGNVSTDGMIGGYAGGIGVRIDSGSSATNYDIRIFHGFGLPYFRTAAITSATNASPIVVTQSNHGFQTNDQIEIDGCTGNTATNGIWTVTRIDGNTYSLNGSTGNGALIVGGGSHYISNVLLNTNAFGEKLARIHIHKANGVFNIWLNDTILIGSVTYVASGDPSGAGPGYGFGSLGMMAKTLVASTGSTNMYVYELNYGGKV